MAVESKSIDEILVTMADAYDGLTAPKRIYRNDNNKLWLVFKAIAAGYVLLLNAIIALRDKFSPERCADEDLYSTADLVGTKFKSGSGSLLQITATNTDSANSKVLEVGVYNYTSVSGEIFEFELTVALSIAASAAKQITAISKTQGAFLVTENANIVVYRVDAATIDPAIKFSCADNSGTLGYGDETAWEFRKRILSDTDRQDAIKELELNIRNLPNILECNVILNQSNSVAVYDGISLNPYQLLIVITGSPGADLAELVASSTIYLTKMVDPDDVVFYADSHYIGGGYPVYFARHQGKDFALNITYQFDSTKILQINAETAMNTALNAYRNSSRHVAMLTENDVYALLNDLGLTSVKILNVDILVSAVEVPYLVVEGTRVLNLTGEAFVGIDTMA
jgi:hypothetical protein